MFVANDVWAEHSVQLNACQREATVRLLWTVLDHGTFHLEIVDVDILCHQRSSLC